MAELIRNRNNNIHPETGIVDVKELAMLNIS